MQPLRVLRLALATVIVATPMSAQNSVSIAAGPTIPLGTAADAVNTGYNASVAITGKPPLASVGIRLEAMFNSLSYKGNAAGNSTLRILGASANATLSNASTPLRSFYLIGGLGVYNTKSVGATVQEGNNDVGFNVGLGLTLTTAVGTFVEARYHHIPSELNTLILLPITFGIRF